MKLGIQTSLWGSAGTRNLLEIAEKYEAKFLHASTSEGYGDPEQHPKTEVYRGHLNPIGPRWDAQKTVQRVMGSQSGIVFQPLPQDDPSQRQPDISQARRLLNWEPKIDLEAGLRLSLDYFRACVEAAA